MALAPFPDDWLEKSDDEVGKELLRWFIGFLADKSDLPVDQIPQDFQERAIQRIIPNAEAQTAESAALALALRKAASGDLQSAGRIILEYMNAGAVALRYTPIGKRRSAQQKEFRADRQKDDVEKHEQWRRWQACEINSNPQFAKQSKQEQAKRLKKTYSIKEDFASIAKRLDPLPKSKSKS